ncbi:MAG: DUF222 domain-containing protein [Propionibacteriales bacterium]|nr:DUF222 domain-containing protein [Propionibacteriales bacterium]
MASAVDELTLIVARLGRLSAAGGDEERIDRIALLDKIQAAAALAVEIASFEASQLAEQRGRGVTARRLGHGIAEQVALARKVSPATGARQICFSRTLTREMPRTHQLLSRGEISEWVATLAVRETRALSPARRRRADADLACDLPRLSPRQAEAVARRVAIELDPHSAVRRGRTARGDRHVSIRPAPDTMALLTGFVPCEQGIAAWAALDRYARRLRSQGDSRSLGQIMSDAFVERLTGQQAASALPVEIGLTMAADSLLDDSEIPAWLESYGPVPAALGRDIVGIPRSGEAGGQDGDGRRDSAGEPERARVFLRRILTDPFDETVAHVDTSRRRFDGAVAVLVGYRDQVCRVPFCNAPIRHLDHVVPYRDGGPTTAGNGQGLCERDSYVKEMPGWQVTVEPNVAACTVITTPTGHSYRSDPPPAFGPGACHRARHAARVQRRVDFLLRERLIAGLPPPRR